MKITEDVRAYAAEKQLEDTVALEAGMKEKAEQFKQSGSQLYS
jgi:phosphomethylpyrimidine synthase